MSGSEGANLSNSYATGSVNLYNVVPHELSKTASGPRAMMPSENSSLYGYGNAGSAVDSDTHIMEYRPPDNSRM